ncbi:MAG TPA: choline/ethanolamine kinase family protein [Candidatus Limnocylindrales bacterium]|nr:choline/ethanolamine kinase family protein [Candidatus Limnocylindrales bacterium]
MSALLDAARALEQVPGWHGRVQSVEPLEGGITNRNYRVEVDGVRYVMRVPAERGDLLGIDRQAEHDASLLAASVGVGPEVVAFVSPPGLLITRFIEGVPVPADAVRDPRMLARIAEALRRVHAAGRLAATFSPFRVVEAYARTAVQHGVTLPDAFTRARACAAEIERALPAHPPRFCHNDLLNANFIDDGRLIRIVDWEYAGMGDPFFDFGNFAVNHALDEAQEQNLLDAYFGEVSAAAPAHLRLMRIMSDFREAMWGLVQQGVSSLDFDFAGYARKHFDRLLEAAADPGFSGWLGACAG